MNATPYRQAIIRAISTGLLIMLIMLCALAGCGKTGPLYLPDDSPSETEQAQ